jgi:hypothetical protein
LHPIFAIDEPMHLQAPEAPGFGILKQLQPWRNPTKPQLPALFKQPGPKPDLCSGRGPRSIVSFHLRRMAKGVSTGVWFGEQRNRKPTI